MFRRDFDDVFPFPRVVVAGSPSIGGSAGRVPFEVDEGRAESMSTVLGETLCREAQLSVFSGSIIWIDWGLGGYQPEMV
jgi:hypothetical protein